MKKYVAFLRGINVGGHHKVPMVELKKEMAKMNFENVVTLLNSGNIIFDGKESDLTALEKKISGHLEKTFGFQVPTLVRDANLIYALLNENPFKNIEVTQDVRLYVSFLAVDSEIDIKLPWRSEDGSYKIRYKKDKTILSVLDLSKSGTPEAMGALERLFGKGITTRNWNTILRLGKKLNVGH